MNQERRTTDEVTKDEAAKQHVAVIGIGYWGKNLVRTFDSLGVLRTVCDSDRSRLEAAKAGPAVRRCSEFEEVLRDPEVKAVAIAAPAVSHYELARSALQAGKDVFVEKPLALTVRDGQELVKLAEDEKRILMVGHILRYHPAVRRLKEMVDTGELGKVEYIYSDRLSIGKLRTEENILWSFAPHDVSVLLGLLGEMPAAVSCQGGDYLSRGVCDVTVSQFTFPGGVRAHIFVSWLHPFKEQRLVVVGSDKMAVFDDTAQNKLVTYPHKVEWKNRVPTAVKAEAEVVAVDTTEPLKAECLAFLESLKTRKPPVTDGQEGLRVLRVLDACQRSLSTDGARIVLCPPITPVKEDYGMSSPETKGNLCKSVKSVDATPTPESWQSASSAESVDKTPSPTSGDTAQSAESVKSVDSTPAPHSTSTLTSACRHVVNQYVIRAQRRNQLQSFLKERGIGTEVYYPLPLHLQECFAHLGYKPGDFPESENAAQESLALPVYPELSDPQAKCVVDAIQTFYAG